MATRWKQPALYGRWNYIQQALYNPNSPEYAYVQSKGLTCHWVTFKEFERYILKHLGLPQWPQNRLHRKNQDLGWIPGNLMWASAEQLSNNISQCIFYTYKRKRQSLKMWSREYNIPYRTVMDRHLKGWPIEKIISRERHTRQKR